VKVKKYYSQLSILAIAGLSILTAQPLCAANSQATDLKLDSKKDGVANVLKTLGNLTKNIQSKIDTIAQTPIIEEKNPGLQNIPELSTPTVIPSNNSDVMVPNPKVTVEDKTPTNSSNSDRQQPGQTSQTSSTGDYLPRAVAPPVGDMAISNINAAPALVNLGSTKTVSRLVLKDAPVREVLSTLLQSTGLNLVFIGDEAEGGGQGDQAKQGGGSKGKTISLDVQNEPVQQVFNSVLLATNLQANRQGNTVFVGVKLPSQARNLMSRTLRLNQVTAANAAAFLASQGAEVQRLNTTFEDITDPQTGKVIGKREKPSDMTKLTAKQDASGSEALLLKGLSVATDDRLNSITLIGEARLLETATSFLTQLDARRRQLAVNVKVVDINLLNEDFTNSSFSFGVDDSFFVQDNGTASMRFGNTSPASRENLNSPTGRTLNPPGIPNPLAGTNTFLDLNNSTIVPGTEPGRILVDSTGQEFTLQPRGDAAFFNRNAAISQNPTQTGVTDFTLATDTIITAAADGTLSTARGALGTATSALPGIFQFPKKFLALLESRISNGNAKILTDPTLVIQEGQQATVKLTQEVVKSIKTTIDPQSGVRITTPEIGEAGLTLSVNVERVDDNGFVALSVSPTVSAVGNRQNFDSGNGAVNQLSLLTKRELSSGLIRLRDGQTLILSGIIQDSERTTVSKVPFLGDIPILGSLFRSTTQTNTRAEVVVLLTPQVMDDSEKSQWGFNYNPSEDARQMLQKKGFTPSSNP
jgi:type IV pilus assembly protein PilQ